MVTAYLLERGIEFDQRDVTCDQASVEDLVHKYGSRSTPTIVIGDEVMVGFDRERLDHLLSR